MTRTLPGTAAHPGRRSSLWVVLLLGLVGRCLAQPPPAAPTILAQPPGAGTPYGQAFPDFSVHDHYRELRNLTPPRSARLLSDLMAKVDVPVGGWKVGSPVYIVDGPHYGIGAEASPRGVVLMSRSFLEALSGVKVDPARPASIDAAVSSLVNNPRRANHVASIMAHELGHLHQGHGRFTPATPMGEAGSRASQVIAARAGGGLFEIQMQGLVRDLQRQNPGVRFDQPKVYLHVDEYLADQHALVTRFRSTGDLRGALDFWNKVSPVERTVPGSTPGAPPVRVPFLQDSHPSKVARVLSLVSYIESHPDQFAHGLTQPLHLRVARDLPALRLQSVDGRIQVQGREALFGRLAVPEQKVLSRWEKQRARFEHGVDGFVNRRLRSSSRRHQRLEPLYEAVEGPGVPPRSRHPAARAAAQVLPEAGNAAARALRQGPLRLAPAVPVATPTRLGAAGSSLRFDLARGGMLIGPAVAVFTGLTGRLASGERAPDAFAHTMTEVARWEFLAGDVGGGVVGAALGSALRLPGAGLPVVGPVLKGLPIVGLAIAGARVGSAAIELAREGRLSLRALAARIDVAQIGAQTMGSVVAGALATAAIGAGLIPALALGPVSLVGLGAAIAGAWAGEALLKWWRGRSEPAPSFARAPSRAVTAFAVGSDSRPRGPALTPEGNDPFADVIRR